MLGSPGKGAAMEGQGWDAVYWFITHSPLGVDRVFVDNHVDGSGLGEGGRVLYTVKFSSTSDSFRF